MTLFCEHHQVAHTFTPGEVERIVYTLGGSWADHRDEHGNVRDEWLCPKAVLGSSYDAEEYGEYCSAMVSSRRLGPVPSIRPLGQEGDTP